MWPLWFLFGLFWWVQIIAEDNGKKCDPKVHRLWYAVPNNPHSFIFCHPIKKLFLMEDCLLEGNKQKEFVPGLQQCILRTSQSTISSKLVTKSIKVPSTTTQQSSSVRRHPMYSRYNTFARLKTIDQQLILAKNLTENSVTESSIEFKKCPMNRVPLRKENSNEPVDCFARPNQNIPGIDECGESGEFRCTFVSATDHKGICCQRIPNNKAKCQLQMRPLVDSDGMVRPCSPARIGVCRNYGSICVFDENYGDFHCCEPDLLPKWAISNLKTSTAMNTLLIKQPSSSFHLRKQPYNPFSEDDEGCPNGELAFKDPTTKRPLICTTNEKYPKSICPTGFHCYSSQSAKQSQCCGYNNGHCPVNSAALVVSKAGTKLKPVSCGPLSGCPQGYFCNRQTHSCCSMEPLSGKCEHGFALSQSDGRAKRCTNTNCPKGYVCSSQFGQNYCCPSRELICSQPLNWGLFCLASKAKRFFYYHQATGECRPFMYSGCSENSIASQNRFESQAQCENFCKLTDICPLGQPLQKVDGVYINCTQHSECPENFNCLSTFRGNYCCQVSETQNICPLNSRPYLLREKPMECRSSSDCMPTFECARNEKYLLGYCCSKTRQMNKLEPKKSLQNCQNGQSPLKSPDGDIQICIPNKMFECPSDFQCEFNGHYGRYQCCNRNSTEGGIKKFECPEGTSLQVHPNTNEPMQCKEDRECANFAQCEQIYGVCCEANDLKTLLRLTQKSQLEPAFLSGLLPGQIGCISDNQCAINFPGSRCIDWTCHCPEGLLAFELGCVSECPENYHEQDGICSKVTH